MSEAWLDHEHVFFTPLRRGQPGRSGVSHVGQLLRAGADLAESIESQKAFVESVKSHFKEEAKATSKNLEESVIVTTEEKAPRLSEILNVKVGA